MSVMKQHIPSNFLCNAELEVDDISNLPAQIVDKILSHLSLRDAVRTSVLSSKWRNKWVTLPNLVFDNQSLLISSQDQTFIKNKIVNIVDHVLLLHSGPIHKFKLSHRDLQGVCDIDRWILFLSRGAVKEFILEIWKGHRYKLHSSIYLCQKLNHLELFNCLLKPPHTFNGFKSLKSLDLQHITMEQDAFEQLVSRCHLLERLTLMNFEGFSDLKIHQFHEHIQSCYRLIGLYVNPGFDKNLTLGSAGNLVKFFAHLPRLQRLEVQSFFLKYLADNKVPGRLPTPCDELSFLSMRINFNHLDECLAALCLLRSSPNLQELEMLARTEEQSTLRTVASVMKEDYQNCMFNQLRHVKIAGITGLKQELNFVNFLLSNSPVLERMTVKPASVDGAWEMLKELLRFRRASVQAEIVYVDP
uniref:F-box domain-containing protein n=1 Tax=Solanum lycopersicum TaxID=4081 RepID=A0A3Q7GAT3_SOLLC